LLTACCLPPAACFLPTDYYLLHAAFCLLLIHADC
jgi:hypothetical protein